LDGDRVGEIWVAGGSIARGYWQRETATADTFAARLAGKGDRAYLRTGDLGFLRDGELFVTGRIKDVIILWGRNHYPQDIELTVEQSHPALRAGCGAAFALDVDGEERLAIVQEVERTALRHLDVDAVVKAVREAVSAQHDIAVFGIQLIKTASILKTSSGKIQRFACRQGFRDRALDVVGEWTQQLAPVAVEPVAMASADAPPSEEAIQDWLIAKLAAATGLDPDDIEIDEAFANYGLDSSVALSLTGELGEWLGRDLEPTLFWEYTSVETLADFLCAGASG
ncbi:MAG: phosphopantetheine-binding protein, partial [Cyanobacteria bacterium J06639_1]